MIKHEKQEALVKIGELAVKVERARIKYIDANAEYEKAGSWAFPSAAPLASKRTNALNERRRRQGKLHHAIKKFLEDR